MTKVVDILEVLEKAAPTHLAASYDNVGHIVGKRNAPVKKVLVALDITSAVVEEAKEKGAELIVSHHPVIFGSRSTITDSDVTGAIVIKLIENGISAICMHTNLDCAKDGVNDVLAKRLGINTEGAVEPCEDGTVGGGRFGTLPEEMNLSDFLKNVCTALSCDGVRYHDAGLKVKKVAVGGGSCGDYALIAKKLGCDTVVTADIKHNQMLDAREVGINTIDAGHFATEDVVCPYLVKLISENFSDVEAEIADADINPVKYYTI